MKMQQEKTSAARIKGIFNKIYASCQYRIVSNSTNLEDLVIESSVGKAGELLYIPYYTQNYELLNGFYLQIATKYSEEEIIAATEYFKNENGKERFISTYKAILLLRKDMRFVNAKTFLSMLNLESHYDNIKDHIRHINKDCLYRFAKKEAWDDTFIRRLAIMYVLTSYYKLALTGPTPKPIESVINALLQKEDKPNDIINQLNHLKEYIIFFFKKLKIDIYLPEMHPEIKIEDCPFDGIVTIPWEYVTFHNRFFLIDHPRFYTSGGSKHAYKYICEQSKTAFNYIKKAFISKLPPIIVECQRGQITKVINIGDISICVTALETGTLPPKVKIQIPKQRSSRESLSFDEYTQRKNDYKSIYLDYLAEHLYKGSSIYYCKECRLNSSNATSYEDAFIFRLTDNVLLYENVLDKRASVVFKIDPSKEEECTEAINAYFSSDIIVNKREKIASEMTLFLDSCIKDYKRIYHTSFHEWKVELTSFIKYR